jgi:branched-chain amino acid transport system ATP-binding protein
MLEIKNIYKSFGEQKILDGVSFELEKGKVYTLVGNNGSGKTTIFNIITGFLSADSGTVKFKETLLTNKNPVEINKLGITRTFQDLRIIRNITVKENILLALNRNHYTNVFSDFKNFNKQDYIIADEILEKVSLNQDKDFLADEISYGQQKLLTIGCCLANKSEVLLLDEPISGIDKNNYDKIKSLIENLSKEHIKYILQIEHNLEFIKETSDHIIYLVDGKTFVFENYSIFISDENVKTLYLK